MQRREQGRRSAERLAAAGIGVGVEDLGVSSPRPFLGAKATAFVSVGALVSIGGTLNSIALVTPRLQFAMAAHGGAAPNRGCPNTAGDCSPIIVRG